MSAAGRRAFPWDMLRGFSFGVVISSAQAFSLLIAIEYFDSSETQKALIASAASIGLLISLFYTSWAPMLRKSTFAAALPFFLTALALAACAISMQSLTFAVCATLGGACAALSSPLLTGIYQANYRASVRGQVYGLTVVLSSLSSVLAGKFGGAWLDAGMEHFRLLYCVLAGFGLLAGAAILRLPSTNIRPSAEANPFLSFKVVWENPAFGYVLFAWFVFGFANLMLNPQRIEFITNARYGIQLNPERVMLVIIVVTELTRLVMIPVWARLFDRFNFIYLRMILNCCFLASHAIYFLVPGFLSLVVGAMFLGSGFGGGAVAWQLWVTKFAPEEQTAKYMAVHTCLCGLRGILAPFLGYFLLNHISMPATVCLALATILASIFMMIPIRHMGERRKA
ncbi:MFS transporter [Candidatus Sumerlaeota bacterium]|nr:MFS transporter [Candidatus Sumerlaeota bacterium]